MMIERLARDLDCITDGAIPAGDPHPKPTGIIVIERPLTEDETAALRAAFIAKFGQAPQSGAENIKPDSETADQDGPT
jgi:hypothetical protein